MLNYRKSKTEKNWSKYTQLKSKIKYTQVHDQNLNNVFVGL